MCAVCCQCSLNLVADQVFVGACSIGFFSDLYYQGTNVSGYIVFALVELGLGYLVINYWKLILLHCMT